MHLYTGGWLSQHSAYRWGVITTPTAWVYLFALQATRINHKLRSFKLTHGPHTVCHAYTLYSILNLTNHNIRHSIKTSYVTKDPLSKERPPTLPIKTPYVTNDVPYTV